MRTTRSARVTLTKGAHAFGEEVAGTIRARVEPLSAKLGDADRQTLRRPLQRLFADRPG